MLIIFNQHENPVTITIQLLKQLNVKGTNTTVNETILNHPDYPGLLCISDALKNWNAENVAKRIEADKLTVLPAPIIKTPSAKHLLATAEKGDEQYMKKALNDWYLADKKSYDAFAVEYPANGELKMQDDKLIA